MFLVPVQQFVACCLQGKSVSVIRGCDIFKNITVCTPVILITAETVHDRIIPESAETHHPVGNIHIAQGFTQNIRLHGNLTLPAPLGAAGINEHIHHKITIVLLQFPYKELGVICPANPPQPGGNDSAPVRQHFICLIPHGKRFFQHVCKRPDIIFHHSVIIVIGIKVLILLLFRIFILIIAEHRIL